MGHHRELRAGIFLLTEGFLKLNEEVWRSDPSLGVQMRRVCCPPPPLSPAEALGCEATGMTGLGWGRNPAVPGDKAGSSGSDRGEAGEQSWGCQRSEGRGSGRTGEVPAGCPGSVPAPSRGSGERLGAGRTGPAPACCPAAPLPSVSSLPGSVTAHSQATRLHYCPSAGPTRRSGFGAAEGSRL